jgi:two-component system sensor histidine kinase UhpB
VSKVYTSNTLPHAEATTVEIAIREVGGEIVLTISDDGRITPGEMAGSETLGLLGMHERAHLIGGGVSITSAEAKALLLP